MPKIKGPKTYDSEKHNEMITRTVAKSGSIYQFCAEAQISDLIFHNWLYRFPEFKEAYRTGLMMSRNAWEKEGEKRHNDEDWNFQYWRMSGQMRYQLNRNQKVSVKITPGANPYEQYKQIMSQAADGDFTASELKQIMESVNVGVRAYETFQLQDEVNELKTSLTEMRQNNV